MIIKKALNKKSISIHENAKKTNATPSTSEIIEILKDHKKIHKIISHQLGFIKIFISNPDNTLEKSIRLHIWKRSDAHEDIHDHSSNFSSFLLYGSIQNIKYSETNSGKKYNKKSFNCTNLGCAPRSEDTKAVHLLETKSEVFTAGDHYTINADELHRIHVLTELAVTLIIQEPRSDKTISVYRALGESLKFDTATAVAIVDYVKYTSQVIEVLEDNNDQDV